jgi:hypothetical protein
VPELAADLAGGGVELGADGRGWRLGLGQRRQRQGGRIDPPGPQPADGFTHGLQLLAKPGGETGHRLRGHGSGKGSVGREDAAWRKAFLQQRVGDRASSQQQVMAPPRLGVERITCGFI